MSFNEWKDVKLGELIDSISVKHKFDKEELVFLNTSDILEGKVLHNNYSEVKSMPGQAKKSIAKGDILFSEIRPKNKRFAYVDFDGEDFVVSTKLMVLRRKNNDIDNKFLYKYLTSENMLNYLQIMAEGRSGTFPQITFSELKSIDVKLPPIEEQKAIAKILSDLDNKIEINNKINKRLEEMAQAIFKYWFVDFQFPNEEGKPYKSSGGEMVESELGMIPKGWEVKSVDEICDISIGKTPPRKEQHWFTICEDDVKWVSIKDLGNCGMYIFNTSEYLTNEAVNKFNVKRVPKNTVILSFKLTIGRIAITTEEMLTNEAIAHFDINDYKLITTEYLYSYLKNFNYETLGSTSSIATAINSKIVKQIPILIPNTTTLNIFSSQISNIFRLIRSNDLETLKLSNLRDTLLPKLMSGEITVPLD